MVAMAAILRKLGSSLFARAYRIVAFQQCLRQLECDGRAAQGFFRISAAVLIGIEDRERDGNRVVDTRKMMIGDDEVEPEALRSLSFGEGAHAGIDGDDESHAVGVCSFEHGRLQAVAFAQPMRHMKAHLAAEHLDCRLEKHNSGGAVDVIVAVEQDGLFARDGCFHAFHGGLHPQHQQRVVQLSHFRIQKCESIAGCANAARDEEFRENEWNAGRLCESFGFLRDAARPGSIAGAESCRTAGPI